MHEGALALCNESTQQRGTLCMSKIGCFRGRKLRKNNGSPFLVPSSLAYVAIVAPQRELRERHENPIPQRHPSPQPSGFPIYLVTDLSFIGSYFRPVLFLSLSRTGSYFRPTLFLVESFEDSDARARAAAAVCTRPDC